MLECNNLPKYVTYGLSGCDIGGSKMLNKCPTSICGQLEVVPTKSTSDYIKSKWMMSPSS